MKLSQLYNVVTQCWKPDSSPEYMDADVEIQVSVPYATIGGTPTTPVKSASMGFDWDSGKFIIRPEEKLQNADTDFNSQFIDLQNKYGWILFEHNNLKSENKKLKKILDKYENK